MKIHSVVGIFALIALSLLFYLPLTLADMGGIPIIPSIPVYEPGQKAIVAWNGQEEILILSTDVSANESTLVLRMLPLPSNPKAVEKANFTSFTTLEALLRERSPKYLPTNALALTVDAQYALETVVITFHEKIGTHDITIVKANNASELTLWINKFLEENGITERISLQEFETVIEDYMSRGFPFFVLDLIDVSSQQRSVEPILYWFETSFLYYPLRISSLFSGDTKITLFLLTQGEVGSFVYPFRIATYESYSWSWEYIIYPLSRSIVYYNSTLSIPPPYLVIYHNESLDYNQSLVGQPSPPLWTGKPIQFNLTGDELKDIDPRVKSLFDDMALLTVLQYKGSLNLFMGDLISGHDETLIGYPFMPSPQIVMPSNLTSIPNLVTIPIDYRPPTIDLVRCSLTIDETIESVTIQCHVEDDMSGIRTVVLFYQVADGEWKSVEMKNIEGNLTTTIPLLTSQNINFYIEAFDKAGNKAIDDNNKVYYIIDVKAYTRLLILHNLGIVAVCTLTASAVALTTKIYVKKRFRRGKLKFSSS